MILISVLPSANGVLVGSILSSKIMMTFSSVTIFLLFGLVIFSGLMIKDSPRMPWLFASLLNEVRIGESSVRLPKITESETLGSEVLN